MNERIAELQAQNDTLRAQLKECKAANERANKAIADIADECAGYVARLAVMELQRPYDCYWSRRAIAAERDLSAAMKMTTKATIEHVRNAER
jgi:hypothetical protein